MEKILRLTRHQAGAEQIKELHRIFGENSEILMISETLPVEPREAVARFDFLASTVDTVEAVLPINLLENVLKFSTFCQRGGKIIRAITERKLDEAGNASFSFSHYELVRKVDVVTERL
jgi:hypothetical protein